MLYIYMHIAQSRYLSYNFVISAAGCSDVLCVPHSFLFIIWHGTTMIPHNLWLSASFGSRKFKLWFTDKCLWPQREGEEEELNFISRVNMFMIQFANSVF